MPVTQPARNKLKVANPSIENKVRSYLTADTVVGATAFIVISNAGFSGTNFYVMIGEYGDEKAEIKLVSSFSSNTFTIAALTNSHEASDPITKMDYNQIRFYNMATDADPSITDAGIDTINIDCSQLYTEYTFIDPSDTYFCSAYYNKQDTKISAFSERIYSATFTRLSVKRIIQSGLRKAMTKMDDTIEGDLNWDNSLDIVQDGIDEILARKRKWSFLRKNNSDDTTTAGIAYVSKPSDLSLLEYIVVNDVKLELYSQQDYLIRTESGVSVPTGNPTHYTEMDNKYYFFPTASGEWTIEYHYYKVPATITDLSTAIDLVFVPILIYYYASQAAFIKGNDKRGDKMYAKFEKLFEQQCIEFSGPESSDAEYVEMTSFIDTELELI